MSALNIPLRIIQTSRTRELSLFEKAAASNLRLLHPTWDYIFFDDSDIRSFVTKEFPEYIDLFLRFPRNIQRVDFFRYLAVYRLGGFYFDLDVFLCKPLDELVGQSCIFPFEEITINEHLRERLGMDWEIGNYGFGARAGHPFLHAAIKNCVRTLTDPTWVEPMLRNIPRCFRDDFFVLHTTGPGMLSRTLAENPGLARDMHVLFPPDVRMEKDWHKFGDYGVHVMAASWRTKGSYIKRRLGLLWERRCNKRAVAASAGMGGTRQLPTV